MKRASVWAGLLFVGAAVAVGVQARSAAPSQLSNPSVASIKAIHDIVTGFVTQAAAQVPEDKYSFQPTSGVRTMGQLFGHVANAAKLFCSSASGQTAPAGPDAETLTSKADIQKALAESIAFCDASYAAVNANPDESVQFFGQAHTRLGVMAFNNTHIYEHYGNLVTYMRINGMVPPSSAGGND